MPGLMPSSRFGKPGRKGLVPARGCVVGLTCESDDIVQYAIDNGFFITIPESLPQPEGEFDYPCECFCGDIPSGAFELTHISGSTWRYPETGFITMPECDPGCDIEVHIYGRIFCNFLGNPTVCFGIYYNVPTGLSLQWGKVFTDGTIPLSGDVPEYYGCSEVTATGANPCVVGGDASYSLG